MKLSVSLRAEDVAVLDAFAQAKGLASRSAALAQAIGLLRTVDLEQDYAAAWEEWEASGDQALWDSASGDGLSHA